MKYPALFIDAQKLKHNTKQILEICNKNNIEVAVVTKVFAALPEITKILIDAGAKALADSRIENLEKLKQFNVDKLLLRIPMLSEVEKVVELADISLNSEIETIKALSQVSIGQNKIHKIIIMADLGDLREGIYGDEIIEVIGEIINLKGIELIGLGVNLNCYGGVIPTLKNLSKLINYSNEVFKKFGIRLKYLSGGNTGSLHLLIDGKMPKEINHLRIGEAIVKGCETSYGKPIEGTYQDVFTFKAEIIELKIKPSVPVGEIGLNAFGEKMEFEDKGNMKRVILAFGKQDMKIDGLTPKDRHISIIGASSDHTIVDVTKSKKAYKVGDVIEFDVDYGAILAASTSEYVKKVIFNDF